MKTDISDVIDFLINYNRIFAFKGDFQLIHMWIAEGCDLEKDILPSIKEMCSRNDRITSVSYFGPRIERAKLNRIEVEKAMANKPIPVVVDANAAREFKKRMGIFVQ